MKHFQLTNLRIFKVKYVAPTNLHNGRVRIEETARYSDQPNRVVRFDYNPDNGDTLEQAYLYLTKQGFNLVSRASENNHYYLLADNWDDNFIEL